MLLVHTRIGQYTREEFDSAWARFASSGKPLIYTYFKDLPEDGSPGSDTSEASRLSFRRHLTELGHFPNRYGEQHELLHHFGQQLDWLRAKGKLARESLATPDTIMAGHDVHAERALHNHLRALAQELATLNLGEIDASPDQTQQVPLELPDIYVAVDTRFSVPSNMSLAEALEARHLGDQTAQDGWRGSGVEMRPVSALEALSTHRHLTLLGPPGSGKTTFGAHVLLSLAKARLAPAEGSEVLGPEWSCGPLLPVRVVLRAFAEQYAKSSSPNAGDLWAFIGNDLQRRGWGEATAAIRTLQSHARTQGALILFDGLDECGDEERRARVLVALKQFEDSASEHSKFLLTARPYAFPGGEDPAHGVYRLADLREDQIERFIHLWYGAVVLRRWQQPAAAELKRDNLLAAYRRPDLRRLAGNPLLLTLMATLHSNRGALPDDRVNLYEETVALLLQRWNRDAGADRALLQTLEIPGLTLAHCRTVLQRLAFDAHEASEGRVAAADIPEGRLLRAFEPLVHHKLDKAREIVAFIERRAGLLVGLGAGEDGELRFTFPHRTFQEFLAACHLRDRVDFAAECKRMAMRDAGHWREVVVIAARLAGAARGAVAADELIDGRESATRVAAVEDAVAAEREAVASAEASHRAAVEAHLACAGQEPIDSEALSRAEEYRSATADRVRGAEVVLAAASSLARAKLWSCVHLAALMLCEIGPLELSQLATTRDITRRVTGWLLDGLSILPFDGGAEAKMRAAMGDALSALGDPRFDQARYGLPANDPWLGFVYASPGDYLASFPVTVSQYGIFCQDTGRRHAEAAAPRDPGSRPVRRVTWHDATAYCAWLTRLCHLAVLSNEV